jgi:hypothetical protein
MHSWQIVTMIPNCHKRKRDGQYEEAQGIGKPWHLLRTNEDQKCQSCPETVVKDWVNPMKGLEEGGTGSDHEREAGAELDAFDDGDGNRGYGQAEEAGDAEEKDSDGHKLSSGSYNQY